MSERVALVPNRLAVARRQIITEAGGDEAFVVEVDADDVPSFALVLTDEQAAALRSALWRPTSRGELEANGAAQRSGDDRERLAEG